MAKNESDLNLRDYSGRSGGRGEQDAYSQEKVDQLVEEIERLLRELDERDETIAAKDEEIADLTDARDAAERKVEELEAQIADAEAEAA
jgi:chromosome segregation ATPase